LIRATF
jgi:hypothetical protein